MPQGTACHEVPTLLNESHHGISPSLTVAGCFGWRATLLRRPSLLNLPPSPSPSYPIPTPFSPSTLSILPPLYTPTMADRATFNNPSVEDKGKGKGKGKSTDPTNEMNMDDDSSSESEPEIVSLRNFPHSPGSKGSMVY